jgi:hypothetical protein
MTKSPHSAPYMVVSAVDGSFPQGIGPSETDVQSLLSALTGRGVVMRVVGSDVKVRGWHLVADEERHTLKEHKAELAELLREIPLIEKSAKKKATGATWGGDDVQCITVRSDLDGKAIITQHQSDLDDEASISEHDAKMYRLLYLARVLPKLQADFARE